MLCSHVAFSQKPLKRPERSVKPRTGNVANKPVKRVKPSPKPVPKPKENSQPTIETKQTSGMVNGHEWVDLGLPSRLKWATCNIGADSPHDYGDYYAWGEVSVKRSFTKENSSTYSKTCYEFGGNTSYDAASALWNGKWRMPTRAEIEELKGECTPEFMSFNGVRGVKLTGPNGNSIFLPASGWKNRVDVIGKGEDVHIWSSTPDEGYMHGGYHLFFYTGNLGVASHYRYYGMAIRPVINTD